MLKKQNDYSEKEIYKITVYLRGVIVSLGLLYYGFNNSSLNITQQHISYLNGWTDSTDISLYVGLITSSLSLGCLIGSLTSSSLLQATNYNYRLCLMFIDVLGIFGIVEQIIDYSLGHFLLGRLIVGTVSGLNTTIVPVYIQEFTPLVLRGKTGTFVQIFTQLGSFVCVCFGIIQPIYSLDTTIEDKKTLIQELIAEQGFFEKEIAWRLTLGIPIIMCIIRLLCLYFIYKQPTPTQMVKSNQYRALKQYLYDVYFPDAAQAQYLKLINQAKENAKEGVKEISDLSDSVQQEKIKQIDVFSSNQEEYFSAQNIKHEVDLIRAASINSSLLANEDLSQRGILHSSREKKSTQQIQRSKTRRLVLGIIVQTASRVSGLSALTFYSSIIFSEQIKEQNINYVLIVAQGFAGFAFTYVSFFFIERAGRKNLILISTILLMIAQLGIAIFSILDMMVLSFLSILFFIFAFGIGQGGVTWPYTIELVNQEHVSYCSSVRWLWVLIISVSFPYMNQVLGLSGTFFIYLGATFFCFLYFLKELKETKGLTKEQVENLYF